MPTNTPTVVGWSWPQMSKSQSPAWWLCEVSGQCRIKVANQLVLKKGDHLDYLGTSSVTVRIPTSGRGRQKREARGRHDYGRRVSVPGSEDECGHTPRKVSSSVWKLKKSRIWVRPYRFRKKYSPATISTLAHCDLCQTSDTISTIVKWQSCVVLSC